MDKQAAYHATSNIDQHIELLFLFLWVKTEGKKKKKKKKSVY